MPSSTSGISLLACETRMCVTSGASLPHSGSVFSQGIRFEPSYTTWMCVSAGNGGNSATWSQNHASSSRSGSPAARAQCGLGRTNRWSSASSESSRRRGNCPPAYGSAMSACWSTASVSSVGPTSWKSRGTRYSNCRSQAALELSQACSSSTISWSRLCFEREYSVQPRQGRAGASHSPGRKASRRWRALSDVLRLLRPEALVDGLRSMRS